jgi:hypothetical protein
MPDSNTKKRIQQRTNAVKNKKKNKIVQVQDIMLSKLINGEPQLFAADRSFLETAMKTIKLKEEVLRNNGNKGSNNGRIAVSSGSGGGCGRRKGNAGKYTINTILDTLFDRLGIDRSRNDPLDDEVNTNENEESQVHLAEINALMKLNWDQVGDGGGSGGGGNGTRSAPQGPPVTVEKKTKNNENENEI